MTVCCVALRITNTRTYDISVSDILTKVLVQYCTVPYLHFFLEGVRDYEYRTKGWD